MKYYDLHFRATYAGMRVLIEACEGADGIDFVKAEPIAGAPAEPRPSSHGKYANGSGLIGKTRGGKTGRLIVGEFLRTQPPGQIFKTSDITKLFAANGFRPGSASSILSQVKRDGLIEAGPATGTYVRPAPAAS